MSIGVKKLPSGFPERSFNVRLKGLEPPRLSSLDPKSSAATNYATAAKRDTKVLLIFLSATLRLLFFLPPLQPPADSEYTPEHELSGQYHQAYPLYLLHRLPDR